MSIRKPAVAVGVCAIIVSSSALAGPEWVEQGDAGGKLNDAQRTTGVGDLNSIVGTLGTGTGLGGGDFEDMYLITVVNPVIFQLSVSGDFDSQLFVFNITIPGEAFGLLGNDDSILLGDDPLITPAATDGTGAQLLLPGLYAIAVSGVGNNPISMNGLIFNFVSSTEISGADGPGGLNPHTGWTGEGETGAYKIDLIGTSFADLPEPGSVALLLTAMGIARGRRRR